MRIWCNKLGKCSRVECAEHLFLYHRFILTERQHPMLTWFISRRLPLSQHVRIALRTGVILRYKMTDYARPPYRRPYRRCRRQSTILLRYDFHSVHQRLTGSVATNGLVVVVSVPVAMTLAMVVSKAAAQLVVVVSTGTEIVILVGVGRRKP